MASPHVSTFKTCQLETRVVSQSHLGSQDWAYDVFSFEWWVLVGPIWTPAIPPLVRNSEPNQAIPAKLLVEFRITEFRITGCDLLCFVESGKVQPLWFRYLLHPSSVAVQRSRNGRALPRNGMLTVDPPLRIVTWAPGTWRSKDIYCTHRPGPRGKGWKCYILGTRIGRYGSRNEAFSSCSTKCVCWIPCQNLVFQIPSHGPYRSSAVRDQGVSWKCKARPGGGTQGWWDHVVLQNWS